jgi:hypothetical protein
MAVVAERNALNMVVKLELELLKSLEMVVMSG